MEHLNTALDQCTDFIKATWTSVVMGGFGCPPGAPELKFDSPSSRQVYADSIVTGDALDIPEAGYFSRSVIATAKVAEETDRGKPPWDMKPMLLGGRKARTSKKGLKYNIIPFRHAVPSSSNSINSIAKAMPKDIHAAAKLLNAGGRLNHKTHGPLLAQYPPQTKMVAMPTDGGGRKLVRHTHAAGIYDNMVKVTKQYGGAKQSKYLTFRVVSENSPQASWWHPGRNGQPHVEWIADYCRPKIEKRLHSAAQMDIAGLITGPVSITVRAE